MGEPKPINPREFVLEFLVGRKRCHDCPGDCGCIYDELPCVLVTANEYIKPIREEFARMVAEGFFEPVTFYRPTAKAFEASAILRAKQAMER